MKKHIEKAKEASLKAYAPYSNFQVGCAIEMNTGYFVQGANIENASYGATTCAERSAISTLLSSDLKPKDIKSVTVYNKEKALCSPCGICRQVLTEIIPGNIPLIITNGSKEFKITISELLPFAFGKENLDV